jgi:hypothetical protein
MGLWDDIEREEEEEKRGHGFIAEACCCCPPLPFPRLTIPSHPTAEHSRAAEQGSQYQAVCVQQQSDFIL